MTRHDGDDRGSCWSCGAPTKAQPVCPACGAVQPAGSMDHFARLGVPPAFDLDAAALERAYVRLQSRLHPDRFATRPERERRYSAEQAVAVNEAYAALSDALARARYLLALAGRAAGGAGGATIDDPDVLAEAMATREALAEAEDAQAVVAVGARNAVSIAACRQALGQA
ncbi:MAG: Fe-S protein assembly co-chaperone HscB, partial [Alphaproteobacteria bacterium]